MTNLKKVVIWALVIVNIFFLAFFLWRSYSDSLYRKAALEDLSTIFKQNGIYMNIDTLREDGVLAELETRRDLQGETRLAEMLLGPVEMENQGGSIYNYLGENGQARFSNGGEFDIIFAVPVYDNKGGADSAAKRLLKSMNIQADVTAVSGQPGNETVVAVCFWNKKMIFNCRITFVFEDGSLLKISGTHAADITATSKETDMSSCATALMSFLNGVKKEKYSCTEIIAVDTGYVRTTLGDGLSPAWRIKTDAGVYYVNTATGAIEQDT